MANPMLTIAIRAARTAGNIIARNLGQDYLNVQEKAKNDLVTDMDKECERTVASTLLKAYPSHGIIGEESQIATNDSAEYQWIIDPIDGTTNFVKGIPHSSVSIALQKNGRTILGVVFDPITNEMFTAARGEGAYLNDQRIRVSSLTNLDAAVVCTAFPVRYRARMNDYLVLFHRLIDKCADVRRTGCASLDLCYTACGRFDAYIEQGLKPWDYAAGELIVREAGGISTDFMGTPDFTKSGNILVGNPTLVQAILSKVCDPQNLAGTLR